MACRLAMVAFAATLSWMISDAPAQAREKPIPKDMDKFTTYMAGRFAEASPDAKIVIKGPLLIEVTVAGGDPNSVRLDVAWDYCERERRNCRKEVDSYVANMSATVHETAKPEVIRPEDIRVAVRNIAYVDELRRVAAKGPSFKGVFRLIAGDLWMICVIDRPHGVETLNAATLAKLHLTEDQAFDLGIKNVAAALRPLAADTHVVKKMGLTFAAGDFYESSRMLLHESWTEMSRAMQGHLVVAVPETDVLIYGNGGGNGDPVVLTAFAETFAEKAPKPISVSLFQWTPEGWEVVTP